MRFRYKKNTLWGLAISLGVAAVVALLFLANVFQRLEWMSYDMRAAMFRASRAAHPDIALILVDEASLKAMNPLVGRWPWPRSVFADLIEFLALGQPRAVVFDVLFTENERGYGVAPGALGPNDARLVAATREGARVYHAFEIHKDEADEVNKTLLDKPIPPDFKKRFAVANAQGFPPSLHNAFSLPFPALYRAARGAGVVEFERDRDGVFRRTRLLREYQGSLYPVLSTVALLDMLKPKRVALDGQRMYLDDLAVPVRADGSYLVNMYGRYNTYSISGVLATIQRLHSGNTDRLLVNPDEFRDKIVFVGASAAGLEDLKTTPVAHGTPGVMLHASIASNILYKDFLSVIPPFMTVVMIFVLTVATGMGILLLPRVQLKVGFTLVMLLAFVGWALWRFQSNVVYDMVPPLAAIATVWLVIFGRLAFTEGKDKKRVRMMLSQYVSPAILAEVVDKYEDYLRAEVGSKEHITILFSDIREFTGLSESLRPEQVVEILNAHFSAMSDAIFQYEGTLDKFIGDALMAFWGAPVRAADHARRAVLAGLDMLHRLEGVNAELAGKRYPTLRIGIGINTGDVILGNIGSEKKLDYTAIGDHVNLASRMEGLTKQYGCPMLISEYTLAELGADIPSAVVDQVRVKGKQQPIRIYRPLAAPDGPPKALTQAQETVRVSKAAFEAYLARDWRKAKRLYAQLPEGDGVRGVFTARCGEYLKTAPPRSWDGVYVMRSK